MNVGDQGDYEESDQGLHGKCKFCGCPIVEGKTVLDKAGLPVLYCSHEHVGEGEQVDGGAAKED